MIKISQLKKANNETLDDINRLLPQLSEKAKFFSLKELRGIANQKHIVFLAAKDGEHIIGMGLLYMMRKEIGLCATIEDVVVDERYRGKGIGKALMERLITEAKNRKVLHIDLTSRPEREEANEFYKKLGFERRNTNVYRLTL
ncbi:MAG: GNAT family N-acetyltransferase [Candidatus Portnoybacteria bacterium]|nr:GNAT family N-acetyltransferase [Candidatus Portnoybacteria bacterium]